MKGIVGILAIATVSLVLSGCSIARVSNFELEASPSPEVQGPGTYVKPSEGMARISVGFVGANEDEVTMPVRSRFLDEKIQTHSLTDDKSRVYLDTVARSEVNEAIIKIDGYHVMGSADIGFKFNTAFVQVGIGAYDGFYYYIMAGANYKYFEWGGFIGEFHQSTTIRYIGYWCGVDGCSEEDKGDIFDGNEWNMLSDGFGGVFIGAHVWRLSLNNTLSLYTPGLDVDQLDYDMPMVVSNYTSLGIRLGDSWRFRGGTVATFIRKIRKPHWGLKFSVDYLFGASDDDSSKKPAVETEKAATTETEPAARTETFAEPAPVAEPEPVAEKETSTEVETPAETETPAESAEPSAEEPAEAQAEETVE